MSVGGEIQADAVDLWRRRIREDTLANYQYNMGVAIEREGNDEIAIRFYREAIRTSSVMTDAYVRLSGLLRKMGHGDEAESLHQQALAIDPHYESHFFARIGIEHVNQLEWQEALAPLRAALRLDPRNDLARGHLCLALEMQNAVAEVAETYPVHALTCSPEDAEDLYPKLTENAYAFYHQQRWDPAIRLYGLAMRLLPEKGEAHAMIGLALRLRGRPVDAVAALRRAIAIDPAVFWYWHHLGLAHRDLGQMDEALSRMDRSTHVELTHPGALNYKGEILISLGRHREAVETQRAAVAISKTPYSLAQLGLALLAAGSVDQAIGALREALRLDGADGFAHANLGLAFQVAGQTAQAIAQQRKAIALQPGTAWPHTNLALALHAAGRPDEADEEHRRAISLQPHLLMIEASLRPWAERELVHLYGNAGVPPWQRTPAPESGAA